LLKTFGKINLKSTTFEMIALEISEWASPSIKK